MLARARRITVGAPTITYPPLSSYYSQSGRKSPRSHPPGAPSRPSQPSHRHATTRSIFEVRFQEDGGKVSCEFLFANCCSGHWPITCIPEACSLFNMNLIQPQIQHVFLSFITIRLAFYYYLINSRRPLGRPWYLQRTYLWKRPQATGLGPQASKPRCLHGHFRDTFRREFITCKPGASSFQLLTRSQPVFFHLTTSHPLISLIFPVSLDISCHDPHLADGHRPGV